MRGVLGKTIITALLQVPLAAGLFASWAQAVEQPFIAGAIAAVYEVLLLATGFLRKVWKALEEDAVSATSDWCRERARLLTSGFRRRYLRQVKSEHQIFNVRGLRTTGTFTLKLDRVFVDLQVIHANPNEFRNLSTPVRHSGELIREQSPVS